MHRLLSSIRNKLLLITGTGTTLVLFSALYGFWGADQSLQRFQHLLQNDIVTERGTLELLSSFKKQVQEWKNVLLRGSDPKQLEKYWGSFEKLESEVQKQSDEIINTAAESEARNKLIQFRDAHKTMGAAYRKGLQDFRDSGYIPSAGDKAVKGIDRAPTKLLDEAASLIAERVKQRTEFAVKHAHSDVNLGQPVSDVPMAGDCRCLCLCHLPPLSAETGRHALQRAIGEIASNGFA